jgi:hypothetical protein
VGWHPISRATILRWSKCLWVPSPRPGKKVIAPSQCPFCRREKLWSIYRVGQHLGDLSEPVADIAATALLGGELSCNAVLPKRYRESPVGVLLATVNYLQEVSGLQTS